MRTLAIVALALFVARIVLPGDVYKSKPVIDWGSALTWISFAAGVCSTALVVWIVVA